ncbi:hypothetical protein VFES401_13895 [Aliivibrio fischeri]|uniref:hypothetical protein n=1 Tax=Aliivibrio fischeri TaxID=668 RepID=UPI0007C56668|nr:hypothetical protein [Aliivibrio fischeri]TGA68000.1 hypothetical protein VFES401_13895 [Aliivibrio fischeri]
MGFAYMPPEQQNNGGVAEVEQVFEPTLHADFQNFSADFSPLKLVKRGNTVYLFGHVRRIANTSSGVFLLPDECKPKKVQRIMALNWKEVTCLNINNAASSGEPVFNWLSTDITTGDTIFFNGASYRID